MRYCTSGVPHLARLARRASHVSVVASLLLSVGCAFSPTEPGEPVNVQVVLAPGQLATIEGTSTQVRFDRVSGDSRCPADAMCVLGGDAIVQITVLESSRAAEYELHTGTMRPVQHDRLTIALEQLQPYPFSAHPIEPNEYRATLRVTR
jgi:hypothetical protein